MPQDHDVLADSDLAEGAMQGVEAGGRKVLLARIGGEVHAMGAVCPHAGGPLAKGVLHAGVVTCPWHKAAFHVATGRCTEPPAVDDLPRFDVRVSEGRIFVTAGAESETVERAQPTAATDDRCMVIIGAGAAGALAAQTLREEGFAGRVVMIGREDRLPYDRTVLSKYTLGGTEGKEKTPLQDAAFYERHRIERIAGEVERIDAEARSVTVSGHPPIAYAAALVATGGTPRSLGIPGGDMRGVFTLRTQADAEAIVVAAEGATRAVVAGAGFIGMEAAASLRGRGLEVTVVAPQGVPFEDKLGAEVGGAFQRVHEEKGVKFRMNDKVSAVEGDGRVERVRLEGGGVLEADLVLVGLGVIPATQPLTGIELRQDKGVAVDQRLRAAEGLYAAGDIAAFPLQGDGEAVRVEHWRVAEQQGRVAAMNMLGREAVYDAVPYFWTSHFKKRLDYVGHAETWDEVVIDGDLQKPEFLAFYVKSGRVTALAGWSRNAQAAAAINLMHERWDWTVDDLRKALPA